MDGLLVDSEPLWFEVERAVMAKLGGQWGEADQQALIGGSLDRTVSYLLAKVAGPGRPGYQQASPQDVARWLLAEMTGLIRSCGLTPRPGARELLADVAAAGLPHGLVTSSVRQIKDAALAATGMSFPLTVCAEDVRRTKPDPEPYLTATAALGLPPASCVVLEDSPNGVKAARAAGCPVVAVPSVPVPSGPGIVTVKSLSVVNLAMLAEFAGRKSDGLG